MKVVKVPASVMADIPVGKSADGAIVMTEREVTFCKFLKECLRQYGGFRRGPANARAYKRLVATVDASAASGEVSVSDEDFKKLKATVDESTWMTADINAAYVPFYDAVDAVKDVPDAAQKE